MADSERQHSAFVRIVASGALVSRALGLVRDIVLFAAVPQASLAPFLVAFKFPNAVRDLFGGGASKAAFEPVLSERLAKEGEEGYRELVSAMMSALVVLLGVVAVVGVLAMPLLPRVLDTLWLLTKVDAFSADRAHTLVVVSQCVFPYVLFTMMALFGMGALFAVKHYLTPSWAPALLNVALIACCVAAPWLDQPAWALVVGVWLGGLAQVAVQHRALAKHGGVWKPNFNLLHPGVWKGLWLLIPVALGQATGEFSKLLDLLFAAVLGDDRVVAIYAANRLVQWPLAVFGLAVTAMLVPELSAASERKDSGEIRAALMRGLRLTFFLVLPATLGLIVLREPIVRLLFERGHFNSTAPDTRQTATALLYYTLGMLPFVWVQVLAAGFHAMRNTKTPVLIASASMVLNVLLSCVLVGPLDYRGLALATSIAYTVNFLLLYVLLHERFGNLWNKELLQSMGYILLASLMMTAVAYGSYRRIHMYFPDATLISKLLCVVIPTTSAAAIYGILSYALGLPDARQLLRLLRGEPRETT